MAEEGGDLLHLHELAAGGTKSEVLEGGGGEDERPVIPEAISVSHRRIPLGEEILELVGLENVGDGLIAAVLGVTLALPSLVANLLSPHRLHFDFLVGRPHQARRHCHDADYQTHLRNPSAPGLHFPA